MLSCIFLTRKCAYRCYYCNLVNTRLEQPDMDVEQWVVAFRKLEKLFDVQFHLLLGNELLMYHDVVPLINWLSHESEVEYAFYTVSPKTLLFQLGQKLVDAGLSNASSGLDFIPGTVFDRTDQRFSAMLKSNSGYTGLKFYQERGVKDIHATATMTHQNAPDIPALAKFLTKEKIWLAVNPIHYDSDGGFDFFPDYDVINDSLLTEKDVNFLGNELINLQFKGEIMLQNPVPWLRLFIRHGAKLDWHCTKPMVVSVDADGSMRCCGYRRGHYAPELHILNMNERTRLDYIDAWREDSRECPGCLWSYWSQAELEIERYGYGLFKTHESRYYGKGIQTDNPIAG